MPASKTTTKKITPAAQRVIDEQTSAVEEVAKILGVEMTPEQRERELDAQKQRVAAAKPAKAKPAAKTTPKAKPAKTKSPRADETKISPVAEKLTAVEGKLKKSPKDAELLAERDKLIVELIKLNAGYTFIAKTRGVATSTNRGLCRVLMGGKRL
jgi:hypothetical protein